jgi:CubicO group peptidase (beta-lactamase class C family)
MYLSLNDEIKIAKFLLNQGKWNGEQLISAGYLREATTPQTSTGNQARLRSSYGYLFWLGDGVFSVNGAWGCMISCCPKNNLAVVINAVSNDEINDRTIEIIYQYLFRPTFPAKIADKPGEAEKLEAYLTAFALPFPKGAEENPACEEKVYHRYFHFRKSPR